MSRQPSSSAQDRKISEWFEKINAGEIKLPRFQRHQAWDRKRIMSILNTVTKNLPVGITLILNVDEELFVSRYLVTAPQTDRRVTEHLLDGQQRLTSLWRALHNNYEDTKYFLHFPKYDKLRENHSEDVSTWSETRWTNKHGSLMPLWADSPGKSLKRGLIPLDLFRPGDIATEYTAWVHNAMEDEKPTDVQDENYGSTLEQWMLKRNEIINSIRDYRETITHFNLPYLALPTSTTKDTALQVFINMNTNSKPLSQYDIIRAEIEGIKGVSLDAYQKKLDDNYPNVKNYYDLSFLILATSALMQRKLPNQRGMWDMQKDKMIDQWDLMSAGLGKMAIFLENEGVLDRPRLPTNAVLSVIAALYTSIPENLDKRGAHEILLKKYLWSSFFTDRYENSAASNAYSDFVALKNIITGTVKDDGSEYLEMDVPVLNRENYPIAGHDELLKVGWPKRESIRARGVMAIFTRLGAYDFADGSRLTRDQLSNNRRQYHHVFPDALIKEANEYAAGIQSNLALNCTLITDKTNLNISNKDPFDYLNDRYQWTSEETVNRRLESHLVPIKELKNGGYEGLEAKAKAEKVKIDYELFINKRAQYVVEAIERLTTGKEISASEIISAAKNQNEIT